MKHSLSYPIHSFGQLPAQPWWVRRRRQLVGLLLSVLLLMGSRVQATVIYTVGVAPGANYSTIGAALAAVPSTLGQLYELHLLDAAYSENVLLDKTGTAVPARGARLRRGPLPAPFRLFGSLSYASSWGFFGLLDFLLILVPKQNAKIAGPL